MFRWHIEDGSTHRTPPDRSYPHDDVRAFGQTRRSRAPPPHRRHGRRLPLAGQPRRPRHHRVPERRERPHGPMVRAPHRLGGHAVRRDQVAHPGDRPIGSHVQGRLVVRHAHRGGSRVPHSLPRTRTRCRWPSHGRDGSSRREHRSRGIRVLLARRVRHQLGLASVGVEPRHRRQRTLLDARSRSGHRPRSRRPPRGHLMGRHRLEHGLVASLLRHLRRTGTPVHRLASPTRRSAVCRRAGVPRARRALLRGHRSLPQWQVDHHRLRLQDVERVVVDPRRRPDRLADVRGAASRRPRVPRRSLGRSFRRVDQPRRRRLPRDDGDRIRARAVGTAGRTRTRSTHHPCRLFRDAPGDPRVAPGPTPTSRDAPRQFVHSHHHRRRPARLRSRQQP